MLKKRGPLFSPIPHWDLHSGEMETHPQNGETSAKENALDPLTQVPVLPVDLRSQEVPNPSSNRDFLGTPIGRIPRGFLRKEWISEGFLPPIVIWLGL